MEMFVADLDVLAYWTPQIEWERFDCGAISVDVWERFRRTVLLCHAIKHWETAIHSKRLEPPRHYSFPPEDRVEFRKRQNAWQSEIRDLEGHRNRAAFLASDEVAHISYAGTNASAKDDASAAAAKGTPDWKLWISAKIAVSGRPTSLAFEAFDADRELAGEPNETAKRWLKQVGYAL
jgi:hypothetical protein